MRVSAYIYRADLHSPMRTGLKQSDATTTLFYPKIEIKYYIAICSRASSWDFPSKPAAASHPIEGKSQSLFQDAVPPALSITETGRWTPFTSLFHTKADDKWVQPNSGVNNDEEGSWQSLASYSKLNIKHTLCL